ncbi:hypothetical protein LB506_005229 [Fusarium annulatum]|nr:hypothetical protein LB506_005229 [Fusarium annulatum]
MKASYILALSAPLLALAAPTPANSQLSKKAEAESLFLQTDVGWLDGGDKNRAVSEKPTTKKRAPADADAEIFFLQTDVGWFDGGDKKRASIDKRTPIVKRDQTEKREPSDAETEIFFLQTDVGWLGGGDKKRTTDDARSKEPSWYYRVQVLLTNRYHRGETNLCDNNADPRPEDFDEDLSDCSTFSCASRNGCEYGNEEICEYHRNLDVEGRDSDKDIDKDDRDDMVYLEMKLDRPARKRELEQMNETLREKRREEAQKIKVYEDAEKAGDVWRQNRRALRPWKTYEGLATKNDIALEMRYVNEIQSALDQAQSLEETSTPLNLGLIKTFKL